MNTTEMEIKPVHNVWMCMCVYIIERGVPFRLTIWLRPDVIRFIVVDFPFRNFYNFFFFDSEMNRKNVINHKHTYEASNEVNSRRASISQFRNSLHSNVNHSKPYSGVYTSTYVSMYCVFCVDACISKRIACFWFHGKSSLNFKSDFADFQ